MLVPLKGAKGVNMRRLAIGGPKSSGTTFIELDDVEVPVENLIGQEGMGMRYIMVSHHLLPRNLIHHAALTLLPRRTSTTNASQSPSPSPPKRAPPSPPPSPT